MKKRILILGSSSFSGATTVNYLLNKNRYKIFGTFRKKKEIVIYHLNLTKKVKILSNIK